MNILILLLFCAGKGEFHWLVINDVKSKYYIVFCVRGNIILFQYINKHIPKQLKTCHLELRTNNVNPLAI